MIVVVGCAADDSTSDSHVFISEELEAESDVIVEVEENFELGVVLEVNGKLEDGSVEDGEVDEDCDEVGREPEEL